MRGSSPIKTSQGNSVSPKIKAWQANIPGFSSEVPPNLCTSLADRPASHVRSSSPASRNSSRYGRQSMSPVASRSVASSHSHDQDQFSRYSKDSVASSGDNATNFSRKPSQNLASSAPKRSFDLVSQLVGTFLILVLLSYFFICGNYFCTSIIGLACVHALIIF